jgi:dienelactone hydrolase
MTKRISRLGLFLLIAGWYTSAYASPSIAGDWVGGIDLEKWQPVNCHIVGNRNGFSGTIDFPNQNRTGLALAKITLNNRRVQMEWQSESGLAVFAGVVNGDSISGQFIKANKTTPFGLVRVAKIDPKLNEEYSGSYQLGRDRFIDIGPIGDSIKFIDSQTRNTRYLYPASETSFVSGPSVRIPFPVQLRVKFFRDKQGVVSGLQWQELGRRAITARKLPLIKEEVTYQNGDATVTATLLLPKTKGPFPALIDVGQGYFLGPDNGPEQYFYVRQGLAMMTPTRRTVGGAESNYLKSSFEERASEVLAGVETLKKRSDINPGQIGLFGDSQTAWIAPLAANYSRDVSFLILRVPSALPVTENILFEIESNMRRDNFTEVDIARAIALRQMIHRTILNDSGWQELKVEIDKTKNEKWFPSVRAGWFFSLTIPPDEAAAKGLRDPLTYDPRPILESITIPVLAMNGELDEAIPTKISVPIFEGALRKAGNKDFTVIVLPKAGHNFLETDRPYGAEEFVRKRRYVSGYWNTVAAWLRKHLALKPGSGLNP